MTEISLDVFPCVYGSVPWLVPPDEPESVAFLREHGTPVVFERGESVFFGEKQLVFLIESGLVATLPGRAAGYRRAVGLFGPQTILGAVRALGRGLRGMPLDARTLTHVSARSLPIGDFLAAVEAKPELHIRMLQNCVRKTENQIEGVIMNDLLPVGVRLLVLLEVLMRAGDAPAVPEAGFVPLPFEVTVSDLATIVHATREMTSRLLSDAVHDGVLQKKGRHLYVDRQRVTQRIALAQRDPRGRRDGNDA